MKAGQAKTLELLLPPRQSALYLNSTSRESEEMSHSQGVEKSLMHNYKCYNVITPIMAPIVERKKYFFSFDFWVTVVLMGYFWV